MRHIPTSPVAPGRSCCPDCGARGVNVSHTCAVWPLRMMLADVRECLQMKRQMLDILKYRLPGAAALIDELDMLSPTALEARLKAEMSDGQNA